MMRLLPTEGGLVLGNDEPTFWFYDVSRLMRCAPDVPRLSR